MVTMKINKKEAGNAALKVCLLLIERMNDSKCNHRLWEGMTWRFFATHQTHLPTLLYFDASLSCGNVIKLLLA